MPEDPGTDQPIRLSLGPVAPLLRSMLVEIIAGAPDVLLVDDAPLDVVLLEVGDPGLPAPVPIAELPAQARALADPLGPSGLLLVGPGARHATLVRLSREQLDFVADGRTALLAAIRRAARSPAHARAWD